MTSVHESIVYIAASLDGFIADPDGGVGWLDGATAENSDIGPAPDGDDHGFADFMAGIDALVMGRKTFETVRSFGAVWPYDKTVIVLSRTLTAVPDDLQGRVEFLSGTPLEVVAAMRNRGFHNLYVDGGETIRNFLEFDLIDRMIITRIPILLGNGLPLFGQLPASKRFSHVETSVLQGGLVQSTYVRQH